MFRQDEVTFSSRYRDQTLMYPGVWVVTYVLFCGVWMQIDCSPKVQR